VWERFAPDRFAASIRAAYAALGFPPG
jgi:hypothetical protein